MGLFFDLAFKAPQPDLLNNSRDVGPFGLEVNLLDGSFDNGYFCPTPENVKSVPGSINMQKSLKLLQPAFDQEKL
jgi:hypothetical protein